LCAAAEICSNERIEHGPFADLEELVEIGRDDGQEAQALQQRHAGALRPVQHPLVEGKDAVVTVEEGNHGRGGIAHGNDVRGMTEPCSLADAHDSCVTVALLPVPSYQRTATAWADRLQCVSRICHVPATRLTQALPKLRG
jgi:hypothetical protein